MWLAQNNTSHSKTHPITCTTLYVFSRLPSATFKCIIMLMPWMQIHFQLTAMAPKGSRKWKGKATARAKMLTSVIHWCLSLDWSGITGFISEHICGLIWIYSVCGVKDKRAWNLFYDIILLDPDTTHHFSKFLQIGPHHRSRCPPFCEWWAAFRSYMRQMFDKTKDQRNNWRWDNPRAFGDQVDISNPQITSLWKVKCTGECFSQYGSDDPMVKIEPMSCWQ